MPTRPDFDEPQWIPLAQLEAALAPQPDPERRERPARGARKRTGRPSGARGPALAAVLLVVVASGLTLLGSSDAPSSAAKAADPKLRIEGPTADQQRAALAEAAAEREAAAQRKAARAEAEKARKAAVRRHKAAARRKAAQARRAKARRRAARRQAAAVTATPAVTPTPTPTPTTATASPTAAVAPATSAPVYVAPARTAAPQPTAAPKKTPTSSSPENAGRQAPKPGEQ
jgi:histone H1/5